MSQHGEARAAQHESTLAQSNMLDLRTAITASDDFAGGRAMWKNRAAVGCFPV
jgi:hypothetical protein